MWDRIRKHPSLPVLASVALVALAFPPFNLAFLVFIGLVPWLKMLREATPRQAWRSGLLFGALFMLSQNFWLVQFVGRWTNSWGLGTIPWLLTPLVLIWWFGAFGWIANRLFDRGWAWAIPLVWAGIEFGRSYVPAFAYPWGILALPLGSFPPLIQTAAFGEIFLVSAWCVIVNLAVLEVFFGRSGKIAWRYGLVGILVGLGSIARFQSVPAGEKRVYAVGQTGVDMAYGRSEASDAEGLASAAKLRWDAELFGAEGIIFPEGLARDNGRFESRSTLPALYGGTFSEGDRTYQSVFSSDGTRTDKTRLVIFGEFVPFRDQLTFLSSFNLPAGDLIAGSNPKVLRMGRDRFGAVICFESIFPNVARRFAQDGANVLSVHSIDDWYHGTAAPDVLLLNSAWRAAENGLPLLRSSSLGISAAFDSRGNVIARAPIGKRSAMRVEVSVPPGSDAFVGRGWFGPLALLLGIAAALSPRPKRKD
jgi:apolipoprotein N-acyltransferase